MQPAHASAVHGSPAAGALIIITVQVTTPTCIRYYEQRVHLHVSARDR